MQTMTMGRRAVNRVSPQRRYGYSKGDKPIIERLEQTFRSMRRQASWRVLLAFQPVS